LNGQHFVKKKIPYQNIKKSRAIAGPAFINDSGFFMDATIYHVYQTVHIRSFDLESGTIHFQRFVDAFFQKFVQ
jgi:hypothetical protein